jgi:hypothetical protein
MLGGEEGIQAEFVHRHKDGFDVTVRESLVGAEQILRGDQGFVLQETAESFDFLFGPMGEVGQGALMGNRAFAPAFAEEDSGRGVAIGDCVDVHGSIIHKIFATYKPNYIVYMGTKWRSHLWLIFRKINGLPQNSGLFVRGTSG